MKKLILTTVAIFVIIGCGGGGIPHKTHNKSWQGEHKLNSNSIYYNRPASIALNKDGNAIVAWLEVDKNGNSGVFAKRYSLTTGEWSDIEQISSSEHNVSASPVAVAIDSKSNAYVAWIRYDTEIPHLYARKYDFSAKKWLDITTVANDNAIKQARLTASNDENVIASYIKTENSKDHFYFAEYDLYNNRWIEIPTNVDSPNTTEDAEAPNAVVDASGNIFFMWMQVKSNGESIVYTNSIIKQNNSYSGAQMLQNTDNSALPHKIVMDESGNVIAIWREVFNDASHLMTRRYDATNSNWEAIKELTTQGINIYELDIAINKNGDAMAIWKFNNGATNTYFSRAYGVNSNEWANRKQITDRYYKLKYGSVALDNDRDAIVAYSKEINNKWNLYIKRFDSNNLEWKNEKSIENLEGNSYTTSVVTDGKRNAIVIWSQEDNNGTYSIYANEYR